MQPGNQDKSTKNSMLVSGKLGDYIVVANPGTWMVLTAILVFLVGLLVWCAFGRITTRVDTVVIAGDDGIRCYVKAGDVDEIAPGQTLRVNDALLTVTRIEKEPIEVDAGLSDYVRRVGNLTIGEYVYPITLEGNIRKGVFDSEITVESLSPLSLILH